MNHMICGLHYLDALKDDNNLINIYKQSKHVRSSCFNFIIDPNIAIHDVSKKIGKSNSSPIPYQEKPLKNNTNLKDILLSNSYKELAFHNWLSYIREKG